MKAVESWWCERLSRQIHLARWGEVGVPVLVFPTAGGDCEEIERMGIVEACGSLMAAGRVKLYSMDSIAGRAWLERADPGHAAWLQNQFDAAVRWEVVPAIRTDCRDDSIRIVTAGASIGAFNAVEVLTRHPDVFDKAVAMSGTFDLTPWLDGWWSDDFYFSSPLHWLPNLESGWQLDHLKDRFIVLPTGTGEWEDPEESWRMADVLGSKGIPNRVDQWEGWPHDWQTWRAMLPEYLHQLT